MGGYRSILKHESFPCFVGCRLNKVMAEMLIIQTKTFKMCHVSKPLLTEQY